MRKLVLFVATGAGSGYGPIAPGTWGSGVGVVLWGLVLGVAGLGTASLVGLTLAVSALGWYAADRAEAVLGKKDDGRITIDEISGQLIALVALPFRLDVAIAGFLLFRVFDILKPPPARAAEGLGGGLGVMADDWVAGLYANVLGQLLWRFLLPGGSGLGSLG